MNDDRGENKDENDIDFGYTTAVAGLLAAAVLVVVMFATSGRA